MPFENVTTVPAGEVRLNCRSSVNVWVMLVVTVTLKMEVPAAGMGMVEGLTLVPAAGIVTGLLLVAVGTVAVVGALASVVRFSDQLFKVPPLLVASSLMVRVQVP